MLLFGGNVPRVATPSAQSQGTSTWESVNGAKFLARSTDVRLEKYTQYTQEEKSSYRPAG